MLPFFLMQAVASVLYFVYSEATLNMFTFWVLSMAMHVFFGGISGKIEKREPRNWLGDPPQAGSGVPRLTNARSSASLPTGFATAPYPSASSIGLLNGWRVNGDYKILENAKQLTIFAFCGIISTWI